MAGSGPVYKCDICRVTMTDSVMLEAHFSGKKHLKNIRNIDLRAQQEGKAVYVTKLGPLKLPEIHRYMSTFGVVANMIPGKNRNNPDMLHHVIVEFEGEDVASQLLKKNIRNKHRIQVPDSEPPRDQDIVVYERKFTERRRSPTPSVECPGVCHDQVMMRIALLVDPEDQLTELTSMLDLDEEEVMKRRNICINMQKTFAQSDYGHCIVYPFGSSINGLGFPGCDLDIYMDLDNPRLSSDSRCHSDDVLANIPVTVSEKQKVRTATKILASVPQVSRMQPIINARVPIIKFIHRPTGIHCDVSFKNRMSVRNTAYIRLCTETDARVRPLMLAVRYFAKHHGLAGGGGGMKMSSYALTMITITYLQQLDPPLLHPVLELQSLPDLKPDIIDGWNCNFCTDLSKLNPLKPNPMTVLELLNGFFLFISALSPAEVVLCPLLGKVILKSELETSYPPHISTDSFMIDPERRLKTDSSLCIQDPFELSHNVCRNLPEKGALNFLAHCSEALKLTKLFVSDRETSPPGGLCSLFNINVKEFKSDEFDMGKIISDLSPNQSKSFNNCFKISFPDNLLSDFGYEKASSRDMLKCAEKIMNMIFGDCLKLDRTETDNSEMNDEITNKLGEIQDESETSGNKRRSGDLEESAAKKLKMDENFIYQSSSSWTLWKLVWPRRKQISSEIEKGDMSVVELEAAITEAIIDGDVQLPEPEAVFKVHLLTLSSSKNTVLIGMEKLKSRKRSFDALVQWFGPYVIDLIRRLKDEKTNS